MVQIIDSDEDLRKITYTNQLVSVKYHNDQFQACQELYPKYQRLSHKEKYDQITFVRINAEQSVIAKRIIDKDAYSFISIYKKGLLLDSKTIKSEEDMKNILDKLVEFSD